jgi:GNAT superfamily N-acetyltransferase
LGRINRVHASAPSEVIESRALEAWFRAAAGVEAGTFRWTRMRQGDAMCYASAPEPSILINRVLGIGSEYRPTLDQLTNIRRLYANAGISRFFLHVIPDQIGDDYADLLGEAGYEKYRGWMKFERGPGDVGEITTDLAIGRIGPEHVAAFASIVGAAFDFTPDFQPAIAALANDHNWHLYMGFAGDTPACTGGLYMKDGVGYLDFGATHPDFRRRGGQTSLLNTRIRAALDAGCSSIVTMTGEGVPGDEQHSYHNIQRAGFKEAYLRENWIPAGS